MAISDNVFRPISLKDFFGQENTTRKLKVFIYSAKKRKTVLDHMLFYGPPGLGKTSLAYVISHEMKANIKVISAPSIKEVADMISILGTLDPGDILFIDEIHRLDKEVEETLYNAMEDFRLNITFKSDENTKVINIDLAPFTLIGATTMASLLSTPLRDRFGIVFKFDYYNNEELSKIIYYNSTKLSLNINECVLSVIAERSRQTPRVALNILKRLQDYMVYNHLKELNMKNIKKALSFLGINEYGLTDTDIEILKCLYYKLHNEPVSLETIAALMNDSVSNIRDVNESFLVSNGFIERTKRGRVLTNFGKKFIFHYSALPSIK